MSLAVFRTFLIYCLYIDVATCTAGAQYFEHVSKPHSKQQHKDQKCLSKDHVASDSNHKSDSTILDVKTENDSCQNSKLFAKLASELEYSSLNQIFTKNKVVTFRIEGVDHKIMHLFHRENLWIYLYRLGMNTYIIKRSYKYQDNYSEVDFYKNKIKHDNIVQSFGAFYIASCRGCYFVFMEYLPIELSFADITIETILQIGLDISRAVKYLNETHGISHTDIKKDNIRGVNENGTIKYKLIDFDTAISIDEDDFVDFNRGTNAYTTPESIFDNKICRKSDVWQIGMTMYFLLKRNENMNMLIYDPKQAEARYMSKLSKNYAGSEIEDVLDFILVWCPERRPTIDQVIHCLEEKLKVIKTEQTEE